MRTKLPIGMDDFRKIRENHYYYLDKSLFIKELTESRGEVNLFTRPRRFGKTLNMSMLRAFFEIGTEPALFEKLAISREQELCRQYLGKYPVIFLSLKGVEGKNDQEALDILAILISSECKRLSYLLKSDRTEKADQEIFSRLMYRRGDMADLKMSLTTLMRMLRMHFGRQVILLIDEYDVPLDKANERGYYAEMVGFLRVFLGEAFKTNPDLYFSVVTGCLRISKESIFTGINNLKINTISDTRYDEYFGFTDKDVKKLLEDYELQEAYDAIREWYDGYHFGNSQIYCPWDVLNHCDKLLTDPLAEPEAYWDNSSSNYLVKRFIESADATERNDIECLIRGEVLEKKLVMNLTYDELDKKELLWSVLYQTGYLTVEGSRLSRQRNHALFVIPNREIRELYIEKVREWFIEKVHDSQDTLFDFYDALEKGDAGRTEAILGVQLRTTISYYDHYEGFYHGFLVGLLKGNADWIVHSNREAGQGRSDIQIKCKDGKTGIIIEVKHAKRKEELEPLCAEALSQIRNRSYAEPLYDEGYENILIYGISFFKKMCCVRK